jgi:histidyl-tRNA synthetase
VTGGGRYDNLFQEIGGLDVPGIGFAVGVERLISLLSKEKEFVRHPHLFVIAMGEEAYKEAFRLINQLHQEGIWAELDYEAKSLKSQMRRADKLKARYALILGEEELKKGKAVLRDMANKSQEEISIEGLVQALKARCGKLETEAG